MQRITLGRLAPIMAGLALALPLAVGAQTLQGVTKDEIVIGTIQDLSGPIAAFGKEALNGMRMRVDEANAAGLPGGRKIRLIVEDSAYDTKKAVLAANKLIQNDKIFLTVGNIGTALAVTTLPIFTEAGVVHVFPLGASRALYDPPNPLAFAFQVPNYQQGQVMVKALTQMKADRKWCALIQDDDLGQELIKGVEAQLPKVGKKLIEHTSYKRGATDFSSQIARLKSSGCDTVVLATPLRETIGVLNEAKKAGLNAQFIGASNSFSQLVPKLGGEVTEGLLASHPNPQPYADDPSPVLRNWFAAYKAKFGEEPGQFSAFGYAVMDWTVQTLQKVGPDLTTKRFVDTMEGTSFAATPLGFNALTFSKTKRLGSEAVRISRITNGRWTPVTDFINP
jgi:branched-chain amino acid transport system substrate-binding protein